MGEAEHDTTRVDFYVLETAGFDSRLFFACRLAEKAYGMANRVYAHTLSPDVARRLDDLLWNFRQGSFVPHEILTDEPPRSPVQIGTAEHRLESGQLLINLTGEAPDFAKQFARIAEIVTGDEPAKSEARARYARYREMGLEPETHRIGG